MKQDHSIELQPLADVRVYKGMKLFTKTAAAALLILAAGTGGQARPWQAAGRDEIEPVLARMEAAGKGFRSFEAKLVQKKYTAALEEFDAPESGRFVYALAADGTALLRQEIEQPTPRILTIKGGVATVYQPRLRLAQVVSLGKNKDKTEYLALGLGQSPARLRETFEVAYRDAEKVGGVECDVLILKPKSAGASAYFSSITLWIGKSDGLPLQQKLQEPSGDYLLVTFSEARLNRRIPPAEFEQKLPKGVEIQRIQ